LAWGDYVTTDYDVFYKNKANYGITYYEGNMPAAGAHSRTVNPQLKYITRAEAGSPLIGAASDGGNIGATILYEIGEPRNALGRNWIQFGHIDAAMAVSE
jgi:hypothetical protein